MTPEGKKKSTSIMPGGFFSDWFDRPMYGGNWNWPESSVPACNISENDASWAIELAAPGFKKDEINVSIDNGVITISAESKKEKEDSGDKYTRKEFSYSSFNRSFTIPETADENQINASYNDGVLNVKIGKKAIAEPKKTQTIAVN